jgi:DNA primase
MGWVSNGQTIAPSQVKKVIRSLGLRIKQETVHDYMAYCVFHRNDNTPSLSISKADGRYLCFNPACNASGDLIRLVRVTQHLNEFEAMRFILNNTPTVADTFDDQIEKELHVEDDFKVFDPTVLRRLADTLFEEEGRPGLEYMFGRGFMGDTLSSFAIGYSVKNRMVTVPVYSHTSIPVGLVGRSIDAKRFKNSPGLPGTKVFFNLHRAMRASSTVIVVESAFDAMRVHQSGYPNVVATLGGYVSPQKMNLLNRYFDRLIIATDADEAGRKLADQLQNSFNREVLWAVESSGMIYPHSAKDLGELEDREISTLIKDAVSHIEYAMMV